MIYPEHTGWFYSKLTDVVVSRLKKQSTSGDGSAVLVLQDGCRNPAYKVIVKQNIKCKENKTERNYFGITRP